MPLKGRLLLARMSSWPVSTPMHLHEHRHTRQNCPTHLWVCTQIHPHLLETALRFCQPLQRAPLHQRRASCFWVFEARLRSGPRTVSLSINASQLHSRMPHERVPGLHRPAGPAFEVLPVSEHRVNHRCDTQSLSCVSPPYSLQRWYVFSFVSSVFSFFKFCCDVFLRHRIPAFLRQ